jgi:hypothetical protein
MKKNSPLLAAVVGALLIVLEQAVIEKNFDLKVVGFAALIAVLGAVSTALKGKGASFAGVIGTVGFTLYTIIQTGPFTWNEFILTAALAVVTTIAPTLIPQNDPKDKT